MNPWGRKTLERLSAAAADGLVASLLGQALGGFLEWQYASDTISAGGWAAGFCSLFWSFSGAKPLTRWVFRILGLMALMVWVLACALTRRDEHPVTLGALAYWMAASALLVLALRGAARRNVGAGGRPGVEALRLATLAAAAIWAFQFLLTSHFAGGIDARGYANTMIDALTQARGGHWPVFVGQGELQWNGSIHPFRTAPYYLNLGIVLDLLTCHRLTPIGVVHLTLLFSMLQAVLLTYFLLARLEPGARGMAWTAAVCWLLSPFAMAYVVNLEMYMTVMTFGWLPLVFYGNARIVRRDDAAGWACLAAALSLTWVSHAPVAAWTSLATAIIQGFRLLLRDFNWPAWRRAAGGVLLFGLLSLYYFYSIAEMSPDNAGTSARTQASFFALALAFAAGFRLLAGGTRRWGWAALSALGALWFTNRLYFNWAAGALVWAVLTRLGRGWRRGEGIESRRLELAAIGALIAAAAAVHLPFSLPPGVMAARIEALHAVRSLYPASLSVLQPISQTATALTDMQLGYLLWAGAIVGCVAALGRGHWEARVFALVLAAAVPLLIPTRGLTACFMFCAPDWLFGITGGLTWVRVMPAFSFLVIFTAFMALAGWRPRRSFAGRLSLLGIGIVIAAGMIWQVLELNKMRKRGRDSVQSAEATEGFYRTDCAPVYFRYPFARPPAYVVNGVEDYHLESRLLNASDLRLLPDPLLDAPRGREITLTAAPNPNAPYWLQLKPKIRLAPGQRQIWKFEFFDKIYEGWFIGTGPVGYNRYYSLPASGDQGKSFGVDKGRPKTLAFWNSLDRPQDVEFTFLMNAAKPGFGDFAKVRIQDYRAEDLQIETLGLIPYRVRLKATVPSFLETPRLYIPGYQAKVDGRRVTVEKSPEGLVMVKLDPGAHEVELVYRPTPKLALALAVSSLCWFGLFGWAAFWHRSAS